MGHWMDYGKQLLLTYFNNNFSLNKQTKKVCKENQFRCSNDHCVEKNRRCDGYSDCQDGSDELNCSPSMEHFLCFYSFLMFLYILSSLSS